MMTPILRVFIFSLMIALSSPASPKRGGYLFSTFRDETTPLSEQIYFAVSEDGRKWESLNDGRPVLVSNVGEQGVRDSFLLRSHDGEKVWLIATDLCINRNRDWKRATQAGSRSLVIWESTDLVNWSKPRLAEVGPDDAGCVWAPEAIYDEESKDYLVFWASMTASDNFKKQRIWAARTKDFRSFEKPFIFDEKPNHVIDMHVVHSGGQYYRFSKNDVNKSVSMELSERLLGPWKPVDGFTVGKGKNFEGPICFTLNEPNDGEKPTWCILLDNVSDRIGPGAFGYMPFISSDLPSGHFEPAKGFTFPYPLRHGSVLPISAEELERLKATYPNRSAPAK